jgi:hypothetical protein
MENAKSKLRKRRSHITGKEMNRYPASLARKVTVTGNLNSLIIILSKLLSQHGLPCNKATYWVSFLDHTKPYLLAHSRYCHLINYQSNIAILTNLAIAFSTCCLHFQHYSFINEMPVKSALPLFKNA